MSHAHNFLTQKILSRLPAQGQAMWAPVRQRLIDEYCWYPDWYYSSDASKRSAARPYVCVTEGIPFHYLPANPIEYNNWRVLADGRLERLANQPNLHWHHFSQGYSHTLAAALAALQRGELENAAKYTGVMLHVIEDAGSLVHVQEGLDGTDAFVLSRLLRPPCADPTMSVDAILSDDAVEFDWTDRRPQLLGTRIDEVVFNLYARFGAMIRENRFELVPVIEHTWRGETSEARSCIARVNRRMCELGAHLMHTITAMTQNKFDPQEFETLACVHLEDVQPVHRPYFLPGYGATPIVVHASRGANGQIVPLRLSLQGEVRTFARGMGTGCHAEYLLAYDLPADVYRTFATTVGLHADLGQSGAIEVEIRMARQRQFLERFDQHHPAADVQIDVTAGGLLELLVRDRTGDWGHSGNHVVWAEPCLLRREALSAHSTLIQRPFNFR